MSSPLKDHFTLSKSKIPPSDLPSLSSLRVAFYRRVSTKDQADEGFSLPAQLSKLNNYVLFDSFFSDQQLEIFDFVDEGLSAKNLKRPALQHLLSSVQSLSLDFVIVVKLDRLSRTLSDLQFLLSLFDSHQVKLISISEKIDTHSPTGRFFISILGSIAQLEREQTSQRVHDTFEHLVNNKPLGGATPFGYVYSFVHNGVYTPYTKVNSLLHHLPPLRVFHDSGDDIFPGDYVSLMFNWFLSLNSISLITSRLNDLSIPIPKVIQSHLKSYLSKKVINIPLPPFILISHPGSWSRTTVRDILLNPFYAGVRVWNRFDNRLQHERDSSEWIFVENAHEKLIDEELFIAVSQSYQEIKRK
jgi:DNA invertase Pin-like site-specific DNA recombinase